MIKARVSRRILMAALSGLTLLLGHGGAQADAVADFYRGKTLRIINWASAGGEYDIHGRIVSRYLGKHMPGAPTVVHQTMTGGGGVIAANYLYNVAPRDGTSLAIMPSSLPLFQAFEDRQVRFDAAKFGWIGTIAPTQENLIAWHTAGFNGYEDLLKREFVLGASGAGSTSVIVPTVMNALLGTRIRIVAGYPGGNEINLAMERGESQGRWNNLVGLEGDEAGLDRAIKNSGPRAIGAQQTARPARPAAARRSREERR